MKKHILIVGSGSIGKRHAKNFSNLNCVLSCVDPRKDRIDEIYTQVKLKHSYSTLEDALINCDYDGAVICTPTLFHSKQTKLLLKNRIPILLEKPVSKTYNEALEVQKIINKSDVPLLLGYSWRWWKPIIKVKKLLKNNIIGNVKHVQFHMSAHLADWHPWEPYEDFFMSSKKLGGGALLDESHWIDLMIWFFGMPKSVYGRVSKISNLNITSDDNVDILSNYNNKEITIHLDLFGRPHEKFIRFIGDKGTLFWSAEPNRISISKNWKQIWEHKNYNYERNDMFLDLAKDFRKVLLENKNNKNNYCNYSDGVNVMKIISAVKKSTKSGKLIKL